MSKPSSRSDLMKRLGAVQFNHMQAWCGVNDAEKKVYFSIWEDNAKVIDGKRKFIIQAPGWGVDANGNKSTPRKDHDAKLNLVLNDGYEAWGYFIVARDEYAETREIEETRTSFVMQLQLEIEPDGVVVAVPVKRVEIT